MFNDELNRPSDYDKESARGADWMHSVSYRVKDGKIWPADIHGNVISAETPWWVIVTLLTIGIAALIALFFVLQE